MGGKKVIRNETIVFILNKREWFLMVVNFEFKISAYFVLVKCAIEVLFKCRVDVFF